MERTERFRQIRRLFSRQKVATTAALLRDSLLRRVGMIGISAYLLHLAVDATTAKSLPLMGKL